MRVGIVGAGLQARRRGPVVAASPDDELIVIGGAHLESAHRLARQLSCAAVLGWEAVIARDDLDAVLVLTPPDSHAAISIAAMQRGMHVFCEKPLARTIVEAEEMLRVAAATGRTLKCGFNHRHHPGIQRAREWFDAGRIGEPLSVRCRYGIGGRPGYEREWRADPKVVGGGQLMEQGVHAIDLARWFLGEFAEATGFVATQFWPTGSLEDNGFALLCTAEGRIASIHSSLTQWRNLFSFEVLGRDGYIQVEGLGGGYGTERAIVGLRDFEGPFREETVEFRGEDRSWAAEWAEFRSAVGDGREPLGSAYDGLMALRIVEAVYRASRERRTILLSRDRSARPAPTSTVGKLAV